MEGGPIAVVNDGDIIYIDIPGRKIDIHVSDEVMKKRLRAWRQPGRRVKKGWLARYAELASSANTGAVMKDQRSGCKK
jgi:dihydroxy-acid dehydratase